MHAKTVKTCLSGYDNIYEPEIDKDMEYVFYINSTELKKDLIKKLTE